MLPYQSAANFENSNYDPFIGFKGQRRDRQELSIYINSSCRSTSETATNFTLYLPETPLIWKNSVTYAQVAHASIPNSVYQFYTDVTWTLTDSSNVDITKTFPAGSYDLLNQSDLQTMFSVNSVQYFDYDTNKLKLYPTLPNQYSLTVYPEYALDKLGLFKNPTILNNNEPFPKIPQLQIRAFYIRLEKPLMSSYESFVTLSSTHKINSKHSDIIGIVPCTEGFGNQIVFYASDDPYEVDILKDLNYVRIRLTDEDNNDLDLNGLDWSMNLRIFWERQDQLTR